MAYIHTEKGENDMIKYLYNSYSDSVKECITIPSSGVVITFDTFDKRGVWREENINGQTNVYCCMKGKVTYIEDWTETSDEYCNLEYEWTFYLDGTNDSYYTQNIKFYGNPYR